ncbi:MAG: ABC transporter ATP-binding protein [Clostridia bacterium]|nr:ABC transporter ATP-binding protein [Clostridia bacterium]MBQ3553804.1 ABC transporter ATP-binding protein [Clostridia bacterium]
MKRIIGYLKPYIPYFILAFILIAIRVSSELSLPNLMSEIVDQGIASGDMAYIWRTGGMMLALAFISTAAIVLMDYFGAKIATGFSRDVRKSVFHKVQSFSGVELGKFGASSLITRTINDITQLQNFLIMFTRIIIMCPMYMLGSIFLAFSKDVTMAVIFLSLVPFLLAIIILVSRKTIPLSVTIQKRVDKINLIIREKLSGNRVIRAFHKERYEEKRFDEANLDLTNVMIKLQKISSILMPAMVIVLNAGTIAVVWVGASKIGQGALEVGDMMAVIQYIMHIMMSLMMLSMVFIMYPRAAASAERVAEILNTTPVIVDAEEQKEPTASRGRVEFRNVSFRYEDSDEAALENISFVAEPGETTAIIGSTGSGKSTLIQLIPRMFDVSEGQVLVDGVDVKDYTQKDLRAKIGFVPQKAVLFSGTVASNIRWGKEDATEEELVRAAEVAQAMDFISKKEKGFSERIAQGGTNVSGGQKQRLAIARAIVKQPEIYIFDDSFSALDFKTDANLRKALAEQTKESTVIIVAQRVSTIMNADRILVLDEGKLVGCGKHRELFDSCEVYREIVLSQLTKEEMA